MRNANIKITMRREEWGKGDSRLRNNLLLYKALLSTKS